ncbi:MAG: glycosyltransferase family 2 protein [Actinomycetota bacterium]|nr:glycosyltransferase family 2 protein [Actinomycetota bacterium]
MKDLTQRPDDPSTIELSIVMPSLDEAETIAFCISEARGFLDRSGVSGEIIVADNGSTDGSREIATRCGARLVEVAERGYGAALQAGIAAARGRYVVMGDADASYDFAHLDPFLERLREGDELVMGNRFLGGIDPGAMPKLHKYFGNPALSFLGRLFYRTHVGDSQCGLRAFKKSSIDKLDLRTTGMEFASEMVVKAAMSELVISEVPTRLRPDGRSRSPHLRSWRDGWRHLRFLLLYSPRWLFLYPGCALILVGLAMMVWLLPGPRTIGRVVLDAQTLLFAGAAVVLGYQAVLFAVLGKVFGEIEGLMPASKRLDRALQWVTLETGLLAGAALALAGVVGAAIAVEHWSSQDFGSLDFSQSMRVVVPSLVALMVGVETVLASFFLSVLGIPRRR